MFIGNVFVSPMHEVVCSDALKATRNDKQLKMLKDKLADESIYSIPIWKLVKEFSKINSAQTDAVAIIDCAKEYTYRQMFEEWDKYAKAFSALGISDENKSRLAIGGTISAEPLFCFYGANMTGTSVSMFSYPDFLPSGKWKTMIQAENITDLIISDIMVSPEFMKQLLKEKKKLGLRNVILVHTKLGGPTVGPAEMIFNEVNYHKLKNVKGALFMDELIQKYENKPIHYGKCRKNSPAVIGHTSGTTKGTRKPIPYTTAGFNRRSFVDTILCFNGLATNCTRQLAQFDYSSLSCFAGDVNSRLLHGQTIVLTCFGFLHPKFIKAIEYYKITHVITPAFLLDIWLDRDDIDDIDFSSLKVAVGVGSYASPQRIKQYKAFLKKHGYKGADFINVYGMSEAGAALVPLEKSIFPDVMGFPNPVENFMIKDETDGKFYTAAQGERTGVLHVTAKALACNKLDGKKLFDYVAINGRNFICTNDLVRVNKDGSLSYAGRADKYFNNNEGVRFDSGLVEAKFNVQPGIRTCAIVPVLEKRIHDTVPVLYIVPDKKTDRAKEVVTKAIKDVYFAQKVIDSSVLPSQFILVNSVPCNSNGKVDIYRITRERLQGEAYNILPISKNGKVCDIKIELAEQLNSIRAGGLPEGMGESSAFNIFDLFNTAASGKQK